MARALSRDEQTILAYVRKRGTALPIPDLAGELGLAAETVQSICEYLISRKLMHATVYAVSSAKA